MPISTASKIGHFLFSCCFDWLYTSKATAAEAVAHAREKRMQEVSKEQLSVDIKTCYQRVNEEMNVAMKKQDRIREVGIFWTACSIVFLCFFL